MRALLLAAGLGTRLRPLTETVPKCLVPIHGRPLLGIWLERVFAAGIERAVINTHWLPDAVRAFVAASHFAGRIELFHEETLLGTGGTLAAIRDRLGDGPALVVHADNLSTMDLGAFAEAHAARPEGCAMTMALFETDAPESCGIVERDAQGRVTAFHEKVANPPGNLANAAVYVMEPEIADLCAARGQVVDLSTEIIPGLIGRIYTHEIRGYHRDIGTPEALARAHQELSPEDL